MAGCHPARRTPAARRPECPPGLARRRPDEARGDDRSERPLESLPGARLQRSHQPRQQQRRLAAHGRPERQVGPGRLDLGSLRVEGWHAVQRGLQRPAVVSALCIPGGPAQLRPGSQPEAPRRSADLADRRRADPLGLLPDLYDRSARVPAVHALGGLLERHCGQHEQRDDADSGRRRGQHAG